VRPCRGGTGVKNWGGGKVRWNHIKRKKGNKGVCIRSTKWLKSGERGRGGRGSGKFSKNQKTKRWGRALEHKGRKGIRV